jgi:hypothetical protein
LLYGIAMCRLKIGHVQYTSKGESVIKITTVGIDVAKSVFQAHGVDEYGKVALRRQLRRTLCLACVGFDRKADEGLAGWGGTPPLVVAHGIAHVRRLELAEEDLQAGASPIARRSRRRSPRFRSAWTGPIAVCGRLLRLAGYMATETRPTGPGKGDICGHLLAEQARTLTGHFPGALELVLAPLAFLLLQVCSPFGINRGPDIGFPHQAIRSHTHTPLGVTRYACCSSLPTEMDHVSVDKAPPALLISRSTGWIA